MLYRPQFAFVLPAGKCQAHRCHYSFDASNTPALVNVPAGGPPLTKIPLRMDQDADFYLRALQVNQTGLQLRLEDTDGNPLLPADAGSDFPLFDTYLSPALWCESDGAAVVPLESDNWGIRAPAGGSFLLYVNNPTAIDVTDLVVNLHGVKWYVEGVCS